MDRTKKRNHENGFAKLKSRRSTDVTNVEIGLRIFIIYLWFGKGR